VSADGCIFWLTAAWQLFTFTGMPDKSEIWKQMAQDVETVMNAVRGGLTWHRIEGPDPESTAVTADGPTFKIMCVSWERDGETRYNGIATVLVPHICIINLPPATAKVIWEKAVSSFN